MQHEEEKPCPFCGEKDRVQVDEISQYLYAVCCDNCGSHGPVENTPADATEKWNAYGNQVFGSNIVPFPSRTR